MDGKPVESHSVKRGNDISVYRKSTGAHRVSAPRLDLQRFQLRYGLSTIVSGEETNRYEHDGG